MTYTYAELEVPAHVYDDIAQRLRDAGYDHAFNDDAIDMHGIGLVRGKSMAEEMGPDLFASEMMRVALVANDRAEEARAGRALPTAHANRGD